MSDDSGKSDKGNQWPPSRAPHQEKTEDMKLWGILVFGLIGASATTLAVSFTHFSLFSLISGDSKFQLYSFLLVEFKLSYIFVKLFEILNIETGIVIGNVSFDLNELLYSNFIDTEIKRLASVICYGETDSIYIQLAQ